MTVRSTPLTRISLALITLAGPVLAAPAAFAQTPSAAQDARTPQPQPAQAPPPQSIASQQNQQPQPATQTAASPTAAPAPIARHAVDPIKARYNVQVMEAVLERAVRYAAGQMNRRLQAVSPDLLQLTGAARARGFRLPGYGVFFDVDVPAALRHTMGWTLRLMQQSDQNVQRALSVIRQSLSDMDPKQRAQTDVALKLLETRFQPPPRPRSMVPSLDDPDRPNANADAGAASGAPSGANETTATAAETVIAASATGAPPSIAPLATAGAAGGATAVNTGTPLTTSASTPAPTAAPAPVDATPAPSEPAPSAEDLSWAQNPDLAYEMEVRDALVSAMLEYGSTLSLAPDEYLTIAARDSENVVMPGDLSETVTVLLRIKGSDLFDYKSGRITEADARKRIEVREF